MGSAHEGRLSPAPSEGALAVARGLQHNLGLAENELHSLGSVLLRTNRSALLRGDVAMRQWRRRSGAQQAYMRMQEALYAAGELPLPFGSGMGTPRSIARQTVYALHQEMQPVARRLMGRPSNSTCLEWDYVKHANLYPCTRVDVLLYEASATNQRMRPSEDGSFFWHIDLARELSPVFTRRTFDLVICTEVLEHVSQPVLVLRNLYELMSPGGVLVLTTPTMMPYHGVPYDFFRYTENGLATVVADAGLLSVGTFVGGTRRSVLAHLSGLQAQEVPVSALSRGGGAHDWKQIAREERASAEPGVKVRWYVGVGAVALRMGVPNATRRPRSAWRRDVAVNWLRTSRSGTCGQTRFTKQMSCGSGRGAFPLNASESVNWLVAAEVCIAGCRRRCGHRCAYVSVSLGLSPRTIPWRSRAECSWFDMQACEPSQLLDVPGFRTSAVSSP